MTFLVLGFLLAALGVMYSEQAPSAPPARATPATAPFPILWNNLLDRGGCLVLDANVMEEPDWRKLFADRSPDNIRFLIARLASRNKTNIHTCPFEMAREGEVAVYALERMFVRSWYDYRGNNRLLRDAITRAKIDLHQRQLWRVLENQTARQALARFLTNSLDGDS